MAAFVPQRIGHDVRQRSIAQIHAVTVLCEKTVLPLDGAPFVAEAVVGKTGPAAGKQHTFGIDVESAIAYFAKGHDGLPVIALPYLVVSCSIVLDVGIVVLCAAAEIQGVPLISMTGTDKFRPGLQGILAATIASVLAAKLGALGYLQTVHAQICGLALDVCDPILIETEHDHGPV